MAHAPMLLLAAMGLLAGYSIGYLWAWRRARLALREQEVQRDAEREAVEAEVRTPLSIEIAALKAHLLTEQRRAAQRLALIEASKDEEVSRWRSVSLASGLPTLEVADFRDRPSRRELEMLTDRVRGVAFVDAVTIADRYGLALAGDRGQEPGLLAALAPLAERLRRELPGPASRTVGLLLQLSDARYVALRSLPPWTNSAWLVASASYQPPSVLALDAAVGAAMLRQQNPAPSGADAARALRGYTGHYGDSSLGGQRLLGELEHCLASVSGLCIGLCHEHLLLGVAMQDGPTTEECAAVMQELRSLQQQATWHLRVGEVMRLDVFLEEGLTLTYVVAEPRSPLGALLIRSGSPVGASAVRTLVGRVRRVLSPTAVPLSVRSQQMELSS